MHDVNKKYTYRLWSGILLTFSGEYFFKM